MSKSNRNASAIKNKQTIQTLLSHFPSIRVASLTAVFTPPFVRWVCSEIQTIFEAEQNIINVSSGENSHVHIVGDLHGNIINLIHVMNQIFFCHDQYISSKNIVDVVCFGRKIKFPSDKNTFSFRLKFGFSSPFFNTLQ